MLGLAISNQALLACAFDVAGDALQGGVHANIHAGCQWALISPANAA